MARTTWQWALFSPLILKRGPGLPAWETLSRVRQSASLPLVAIGGIKEDNIPRVAQAGADAACVISAVVGAPDPEAATRRLVAAMEAARYGKTL